MSLRRQHLHFINPLVVIVVIELDFEDSAGKWCVDLGNGSPGVG
jgi:hypothetical protein